MATYIQIASYSATGTVSSIDFSSISGSYTDLVLKWSLRSTSGSWSNINIKFNNSTSSYQNKTLVGTGSGSGASGGSSTSPDSFFQGYNAGTGQTASTFTNGEMYIPNYSGSTNKSSSTDNVAENNATTAYMYMTAQLWSNTSPINQITIYDANGGSFAQYSTATLYGISKS
jgi:hypothetical protein